MADNLISGFEGDQGRARELNGEGSMAYGGQPSVGPHGLVASHDHAPKPGSYGAPGDHYSRQQPVVDALPSSFSNDPNQDSSSHPHSQNSVTYTRDQSIEHGASTSVSYSYSKQTLSTTNSSITASQNSHYPSATVTESAAPPTAFPSTQYSQSVTPSQGAHKRLHVTNIPFRFREPDLRELFFGYGELENAEVIFNERGSKGFGFVTFINPEDAVRAKNELSGRFIDGRRVEINEATPRSGGGGGGGFGANRGRGSRPWRDTRGSFAGRSYGVARGGGTYGQQGYGYGQSYQQHQPAAYSYPTYQPAAPAGPAPWGQPPAAAGSYGNEYHGNYSGTQPQHYRQAHDYRYTPY